MRIVVINKAERSGRPQSVFLDVLDELAERGATVENIVPETQLFDLKNLDTSADLYVLRTRSATGLNLAAALEAAGARLLIPYSSERVLRNKFLLQQTLIEGGVPTARSYLAWTCAQLGSILDERGRLIIKDYEGHGGRGVHIVRTRGDLDALRDLEGPVFAQEHHSGSGADVKLYGIGTYVAATRRVFPARTLEEKRGVRFEPSEALVGLARRCGELFRIGLFGLDVIETADGPIVIDVNSLPGYKGIDGAAHRIAEHIWEKACAGWAATSERQ